MWIVLESIIFGLAVAVTATELGSFLYRRRRWPLWTVILVIAVVLVGSNVVHSFAVN